MKLLRKSIQESDYISSKTIVYQENMQIANFRNITINQSSTLSSNSLSDIDPVGIVIRDFLDNRKSRPTIDRKYIVGGNAILLKGEEITKAMFIEAVDFFLKAFYNFSAQYNLAKRGYTTWAKITNYYSSFFAINTLLRLQGRAISRIWNPPDGTRFYRGV